MRGAQSGLPARGRASGVTVCVRVSPGTDPAGKHVYLHDIWPSREEVQRVEEEQVLSSVFRALKERMEVSSGPVTAVGVFSGGTGISGRRVACAVRMPGSSYIWNPRAQLGGQAVVLALTAVQPAGGAQRLSIGPRTRRSLASSGSGTRPGPSVPSVGRAEAPVSR